MDVTRNEFQDLVGAYALDACDPEEAAAIDAFIAENADAAAEAERLRDAAAWLGAIGALNPPVALRDRLLAAAAEYVDPLPPVEALRRETDRFESLLDSLTPADLDVETFNGLTVRDLVAHVAIVDEAFVGESGVSEIGTPGTWPFIGADAVTQMTAAELPATADWSFEQICDRWRTARQALVDLDAQIPADAKLGGYSLKSALVIRAFETWTHHHDITTVLGRVEEPVAAPVMRTMAELAIQTLPIALAARGYEYPGRTARVVLSGPGGGDWTIACTAGEAAPTAALGTAGLGTAPDVVLRAPVEEFCRRFADRLVVDAVPFEADGDADLGRALVDAAPAFAGL
jgi:uncharacterized protein (TIGR03083 family)